jgi:hypothetical protein
MQFHHPPILTSLNPQISSETPEVLAAGNINTDFRPAKNEAEMKCQTTDIHDSSSESSYLTGSGASSDFKFFPDLSYDGWRILPAIPCAQFSPVSLSSSSEPKVDCRDPELTCSICHKIFSRIYELERYQYIILISFLDTALLTLTKDVSSAPYVQNATKENMM